MRNRTFLIAIFLLINGFIFSEKVHLEWRNEISKNVTKHHEWAVSYVFPNSIKYSVKQYIDKIEFGIKRNGKEWEDNYLYLDKDILIDEATGFLYFTFENQKFLYIPDEYHPVVFPEGAQNSVPYTQEELRNLKNNEWYFDMEKISVSSFLTEKTSKGIWKYDGQDIERFPLVYTPDYKYHFIPMPWVEGVKGPGIGEWIEIVIKGIEPWGTCYLQILNGYVDVRKPHLFKQNNRIKEATLFCKPSRSDEEPFEMKIKFEDFVYVKNIVFDKSCRKIKIRIDSVYEGSKYDDTVITSIYTPGTAWSP